MKPGSRISVRARHGPKSDRGRLTTRDPPVCLPAVYRLSTGVCENFLYRFKAARWAARAANSARSPLLPLALPQRRRKTPVGWREYPSKRGAALAERSVHRPGGGQLSRSWQLSGAGVLPNAVLSGPARTCQERLRRRLRRSPTLDRTCPTLPELAAYEGVPWAGLGSWSLRPWPGICSPSRSARPM